MHLIFTGFFLRTYLALAVLLLFTSLGCFGQLSADFIADKNEGCLPLAVYFSNQTTGASANAIYSWNFDNGNSSVEINAGAIFTKPQVYSVTLTVTDGALSSTKTKQISVYGTPDIDFTASVTKGCIPLFVNFNALAIGGNATINKYVWDYGEGNVDKPNINVQSHNYTVAQKASVSLTVTNINGCTKTLLKPNLIEILPAIQSSFTASQRILCRVTDAVQFTNTSSGPGTLSYLWDFGDGTTSTLFEPSHIFNIKGIYTVSLTVVSSEGCTNKSVQNGFINVASFTSDFYVPALICRGSYVNYNNKSTPIATTTQWLVDQSLVYTYNSNYLSYKFSAAGTYTIQLKNTFGTCADSISKTIIINEIPDLKGFIAQPTTFCGAPLQYNFKDTTSGAVKWDWDFINFNNTIQSNLQNPVYYYQSEGGYYPSLTVTNAVGCTSFIAKHLTIYKPYVSIVEEGARNNCGPFKLKFKGIISPSTDSIVSYKWYIGGTTVSDAEFEYLLSKPGTYTLNLFYTTATGCNGSVSSNDIIVYTKPSADFTASTTTICGTTPVLFNTSNENNVLYHTWDFGDNINNSTDTYGSNVSHRYYYDTTYTVTLIVSNAGYCSDTIIKKNYIKVLPPFPKIYKSINTCDDKRGLVRISQDSKKALAWKWDFGDGTTTNFNSDTTYVEHNYLNTGTYKVVLTTTNDQCSISDSTKVYVLLKQSPKLTGAPTNVCTNGQIKIQINNLEVNPYPNWYTNNNYYQILKAEYNDISQYRGSILSDNSSYNWTTNFSGSFNSFEIDKTGIRVVLRSSFFNCADTTNYIPLAVKGSKAGFAVLLDNVCFKIPVIFKDTSTTNSKIVSWKWDFGDGSQQIVYNGGIINHTYSNPGNYNVTLTVTDTSGCSTSTSYQNKTVSVNGPKAIFTPSSKNTFITLPVYFYNYTNNYNSSNTQYLWQFDDGTTSIDFSPTHAFALPGKYNVRLIVKNTTTNCADTAMQQVIVNNFNPAFSVVKLFVSTNNCPPVLAQFSNNSINYTRVKWDFGDGITADNLNNPAHIYQDPGTYIIKLFVYGPGGLTGTFTDSVIIKPLFATINIDKKEGCIGHVATLTNYVKNADKYLWDFGDGVLIANVDSSATHQYKAPGIYQPAVISTDNNGCNTYVLANELITIRKNPTVNITPITPRICRFQQLTISASGGATYNWEPDKSLNNTQISSPTASPDSTTTYFVTVKDDLGCTNTENIKVEVVQKITLKVSSDTAICMGNLIQLLASGAQNYKWINYTNQLSNTVIANPIAKPIINSTYTITGSDLYNCFWDTAQVSIKVLSLPTVFINPVTAVLLGMPIQLISTGSTDVIQWLWSPADYLNCINCANPISKPLGAIVYKIQVKNNYGCIATADVSIKMQCQESMVFIPSAFSPNDDGLNDVFTIKGISFVKHLIIHSRWGKPIFERNNFLASIQSSGWDGRFKGELLPAGAYTYFVEMECPTGGLFYRKGTVMLVR